MRQSARARGRRSFKLLRSGESELGLIAEGRQVTWLGTGRTAWFGGKGCRLGIALL
jgi:hypothetical protein